MAKTDSIYVSLVNWQESELYKSEPNFQLRFKYLDKSQSVNIEAHSAETAESFIRKSWGLSPETKVEVIPLDEKEKALK